MNYFTAEEIVKDDFLFVSYRHNDKDIVHNVVNNLISMGVRLWYDRDLMVGDNWNEKVKEIIEHEKCRGVLFFNSDDAFLSGPIAKERAIVKEKRDKLLIANKTFTVMPININLPSTLQILKAMFERFSNDEIDHSVNLEHLNSIIDLFNSDTIYRFVTDETIDECTQDLFEVISRSVPSAVSTSKVGLKRLKKEASVKTLGELPVIKFGRYKCELINTIANHLFDKDGIVTDKGKEYIVDNGKAFTINNLEWIALYCEGDETILISEQILDLKTGGAELNHWLNTFFRTVAFSQEESECIVGDISLLGEKDISSADSENFMRVTSASHISEKIWWINSFNMGVMQRVVREDGSIYKNGYHSQKKLCGVRPVIRVNISKITLLDK